MLVHRGVNGIAKRLNYVIEIANEKEKSCEKCTHNIHAILRRVYFSATTTSFFPLSRDGFSFQTSLSLVKVLLAKCLHLSLMKDAAIHLYISFPVSHVN
jgi:hypothetical protein